MSHKLRSEEHRGFEALAFLAKNGTATISHLPDPLVESTIEKTGISETYRE